MATANNQGNNLSPWQPGQSGNPSGRPKGTRDLAGYVLESTDGGKELVDALVSIARGVDDVSVMWFNASAPAWSPDGGRITFTSVRN